VVNTERGTLIRLPYQVNLFLKNWETCRLESRETIKSLSHDEAIERLIKAEKLDQKINQIIRMARLK